MKPVLTKELLTLPTFLQPWATTNPLKYLKDSSGIALVDFTTVTITLNFIMTPEPHPLHAHELMNTVYFSLSLS